MDWETRYALNRRPFGEEPTPLVREVFDGPVARGLPSESARILCPGDGYRRNGVWLAQRGHSVTGLELVPSAGAVALTRARAAGVDYRAITADLTELPIPLDPSDRFDAVVSAWVRLPLREDRLAWNRECRRQLEPGAVIVLVAGTAITDAATECAEWPDDITWRDCSTADEVRLLGHVGPSKPSVGRPIG